MSGDGSASAVSVHLSVSYLGMGLQHDSTTTLTNYSTLLVLTVDMGVQGRERPTGVRAPIDTTLNTKPWVATMNQTEVA